MQRIVINDSYGGFGLSYEAVMRYAELKGFRLWAYLPQLKPKVDFDKHIPYKGDTEAPLGIIFYYRGPWLEEQDEDNRPESFSPSEIARDDPALIEVVEEMGSRSNGTGARLKIVKVPDNLEWEIKDYDGIEWVAEKHRTWD